MKLILLIPGLLIAHCATSQLDSVDGENAAYLTHMYSTETHTVNASYNYSNLWDLDGDGKNDSLYFIGNGGAHVYYYLRVTLSSKNVTREFIPVQLDMPYMREPELLNDLGKSPVVQFVVNDFDKDGMVDLYLNFNNTLGPVPRQFRQMGVRSKYIILGFPGGKMKVRDY